MTSKALRLVLVTDAWLPQVNGVVRTLQTVTAELEALGHQVTVIAPDRFRTIPCPTYPEIRLSLRPRPKLNRLIDEAEPTAIHIATEGPLGWATRDHCLKRSYPFTTAYHTRFPEYIHARIRLPLSLSYAVVRRFHNRAGRTMVATESLQRDLAARGFKNLVRWSRGVDTELFRPREPGWLDLPRPIVLYVGRIAIEKNIEAFLSLKTPGTKLAVGHGPLLDGVSSAYPDVVFAGPKSGEELARYYAAADVFVFPSRTDTFGLVLLEALASGVPVAAYPVPGPLDIIGSAPVGVLDDDLQTATERALSLSRERCRAHARAYSWRASTAQFLENLLPFDRDLREAA